MTEVDVLILGGGIAGLSCRASLGQHARTLLLEAQPTLGGLLRVYERGDFVFDTTVHLLFFRDPKLERWLSDLLPLGVHRVEKRNLVWQNGRQIPYPYQYNAHALSEAIRRECYDGFLQRPGAPSSPSFEHWLLSEFGSGFYRRFFGPYNEKLYGVSPSALEAEPLTWMIPADTRDAVLSGMTAESAAVPASPSCRGFYPRGRRGIAALVDALVSVPGGRIRTQSEAIAIDAAAHSVTTASGQKVRYDQLVSTLPLPVLLSALDPLPLELRSLLGSHRDWYEVFPCTRLTVVEIGSKESGPGLAAHWTYFPDADQPFYRLVRLEAISPDLAPPGGTSLLLECQGHRSVDQSKILSFLSSIHVLPRAQADHFAVRHVAYAYALFTPSAREASRRARVCLDQLGIQSVGRYGTWTYASVEDAVRSGIGAAERLRRPPPALHGAPP